jgi:putative hydrolase of the HAD superfamily
MKNIKAIGFDLFNTLITGDPGALHDAVGRLKQSLRDSGIPLEDELFIKAYKEHSIRFIKEAHKDGRETHNRFWISAALESLGFKVAPHDTITNKAVDAYFSAFPDHCLLVPGTEEMLRQLKETYRLGLLSNFTHAPAARMLTELFGLIPYFDVILISGELGYRKPHPMVFEKLIEQLGFEGHEILFVGDDPEPDIIGALNSGIQPVWMTYVRDNSLPTIPGFEVQEDPVFDSHVPRISSWDGLFALLNQK